MIESTRSSSPTAPKLRRRADRGTPLAYEKGEAREARRLEDELIAAGLAGTADSAHTLIRDFPREYARFLKCVIAVDASRLAVINRAPEAVLEGIESEEFDADLLMEEVQRDGHQNTSVTAYRETPDNHPEKKSRARVAAHACFREGHVVVRLGHAILRKEQLQ